MAQKSEIQLEILISTMNRSSLNFLQPMFKNCNLEKLHILIINQTTQNCLLSSDRTNIRVINSFETGLSKSRNLAIDNAIGEICLLADDDVVYVEEFDKKVCKSYASLTNAHLIAFQTKTFQNKLYSKYPKGTTTLNGFEAKVLSIEISFRRNAIIKKKLQFDEHFGLGGTFEDRENYIFLKTALKQLSCFFVPDVIVMHEHISSSDDVTSDRFIFARSALNYKFKGALSNFYNLKLLFSLLRKRMITFRELPHKWKVARQGITTYKMMNNEN